MRTVVSACLAPTSVCPERPVQSDTSLVEYEYTDASIGATTRAWPVRLHSACRRFSFRYMASVWHGDRHRVRLFYMRTLVSVWIWASATVLGIRMHVGIRMMNYSIIIIILILNIRTRG